MNYSDKMDKSFVIYRIRLLSFKQVSRLQKLPTNKEYFNVLKIVEFGSVMMINQLKCRDT